MQELSGSSPVLVVLPKVETEFIYRIRCNRVNLPGAERDGHVDFCTMQSRSRSGVISLLQDHWKSQHAKKKQGAVILDTMSSQDLEWWLKEHHLEISVETREVSKRM